MTDNLKGVIAAVATAVDESRRARLRALDCARSLPPRQRLRRAQRARHHRRGHVVLARSAQARHDGLSGRRPSARSSDGRHRRGGSRGRGRADAPRRRARVCRRAAAAAILLQGRAGRWPGDLRRYRRGGDRGQARSRSTSITSRPNPGCRGTSSCIERLLERARRADRGVEGFLRRHGLRPRGSRVSRPASRCSPRPRRCCWRPAPAPSQAASPRPPTSMPTCARSAWRSGDASALDAAVAIRKLFDGKQLVSGVKALLAHIHRDPAWARVQAPLSAFAVDDRAAVLAAHDELRAARRIPAA